MSIRPLVAALRAPFKPDTHKVVKVGKYELTVLSSRGKLWGAAPTRRLSVMWERDTKPGDTDDDFMAGYM